MDVLVQDDAFQENDIGPLVHDSRSSEEYDGSRREERVRLQPFSRAATHITTIFQERFNGLYHTWNRTQGQRARKHTGGSISFTEKIMIWQKDLTERFSWSKYLEELHKHQKREKKGKAKEDAEESGTPMPNDLQLMAIVADGVSRSCLHEAGSELQLDCLHIAWITSKGLCGRLTMLFQEYLPPSMSTCGGYSSIISWHTFYSRR
ncbi:hypothetical protein M9H77_16378 [Catharanthus roseus]|uniref:Uncharacterized protein n=1 Tax=Catharanthus roseus TaxID=4058 RepID=A0ACC0B1L4_CATRO|nr:hypothetical protein M9H77_16378 [Catharanthus roseus]